MTFADRPAWQRRAKCRGVGVALFFPERGESPAKAKALCDECPVRAECLDYALGRPEKFGVWGGTSDRQRRRLRSASLRQQRAAS